MGKKTRQTARGKSQEMGEPGNGNATCNDMEEEEEEEEVAVGAMVLIEMVIDLVVAIGKVVVEEDQEMTAIIGTVLVPMNVVVQETSVQGRKNTPDSKQLEVLLLLAGGVKVSPVASLLHGCLGGRIGLISL